MDSVVTMINSPTYGRFVFDAVFNTDHSSNLTVTQHPVQSGASISDHAFMEPDEVNIEIGMSDAASKVGTNHSVNAYAQLRTIMEKREPVTLITRLKTYHNMLITSMSAPDDYTTMNALRVAIYFQQVSIVSVSTVKVQEVVSSSKKTTSSSSSSSSSSSKTSSAKTSSTTTTTKSTTSTSSSALKQIATALGL